MHFNICGHLVCCCQYHPYFPDCLHISTAWLVWFEIWDWLAGQRLLVLLMEAWILLFWTHSLNGSAKSMFSQYAPDVYLQIERCHKNLAKTKTATSLSCLPISLLAPKYTPDTQSTQQQPHCATPSCKFPSLSFFSSHTPFGSGPSHAIPPLRVLVAVGLPYRMPVSCLIPS